LSFKDGSILLLPEGTTIEAAAGEAAEHDAGTREAMTKVVRLVVLILAA
jgi:hypothetical protein